MRNVVYGVPSTEAALRLSNLQLLLDKVCEFVHNVTDMRCDIRLCSTIHVEGGLATGTACSGSNTWPLVTTWLQRSVDYTYCRQF